MVTSFLQKKKQQDTVFMIQLVMVKFRDSCQSHSWARPAEKGPSWFKVMLLSESVHIAPLAQSLIFTRKLAAIRIQVRGAGSPAPCTSPPTVTAPKLHASNWLCQNSVLLRHVPEPASHQPSITTQLLHVLGKAAKLPTKSHKLPKPKPAESQILMSSTDR